jgi:hypothetical protein
MKIRKSQASLAVRLWVLATVFVIPFVTLLELAGWLVLGGVLGLVWKVLPEEAVGEVERLPFQRPPPQPSPKGEGESH